MKAGYIGLIGLPNAGKSTLTNTLIGEKVGIVTPKAQTTRQRVLGIWTEAEFQAVMVDAPGVIQAKQGLNGFLQEEYKSVMSEADALLCCVNPDEKSFEKLQALVEMVSMSGKVWAVVITKEDIAKPHRLVKLREFLSKFNVPVICISALKGKNYTVQALMELVPSLLPEAPSLLFDPEDYTTQSMREIVAEWVREKCFLFLHQELPYGLAVHIRKYEEKEHIHRIFADIIVAKPAHKNMVVGSKGQQLGRIGTAARKEIEAFIGCKCYLELHVKVKPTWMSNKSTMRELGYVST